MTALTGDCRSQAELLGSGRSAHVYAGPQGTVIKLFGPSMCLLAIQAEASVGRLLANSGVPAPALRDMVMVAGLHGLVFERVAGVSLARHMHRRPWTIATQARDMARLHARLARFRIPGLPDIKTRLHREIADHVGLPTQSAHSRQHAWEMLDALPCGDALLHGDFHPGNVMRCPQGLMAIDWGDAARGDPCADVATTLLLMAVGNLPASGGIDALVLRLGRRHALSSYRQARLQIGDVEPRAIARWLHLMALLREWYPAPSDNLRLVRHLAGSMAACARLAGVRW